MSNQNNKVATDILAQALAQSVAQSFTEALGSPWEIKVLDEPDLSKRNGKSVHLRLRIGGALRGNCFIELYEIHIAELGSKLLNKPSTELTTEQRTAVENVISSSFPAFVASLSTHYGAVTCELGNVEDLAFGGMFMVPMSAISEGSTNIPLLLYFDAQMMSALSPEESKSSGKEGGLPSVDPANLKLVMDVELNVSLRFGQRQLPLREVLELVSGSVVELDRQVDDPVELLLDGKVIARGEAVIVDGNYGLRITEITQPVSSYLAR